MIYMRRCFQLARLGETKAHPNPMVGSVIVHNGQIIGEGYHTAFGKPHAEVEAIRSVKNQDLLSTSTLYVNLEPCSHYGKTPPCADLIIEHKIPEVVISNLDPHDKVAGQGVARLRNAGVHVITGVLEHEGATVNRAFFTYHSKRRPYILLKWAQTADGFIGRLPGDLSSKQISGKLAARHTHKLRAQSGAILIGTNTAIEDNPSLTCRYWPGRNPLRIVFDRAGKIPASHHLFADGLPTVVIGPSRENLNAEFVQAPNGNAFDVVLDLLFKKGITQLMVEGGAHVLNHLIEINMWDECHIIQSPRQWHNGVKAPKLSATMADEFFLEQDRINIYLNQ